MLCCRQNCCPCKPGTQQELTAACKVTFMPHCLGLPQVPDLAVLTASHPSFSGSQHGLVDVSPGATLLVCTSAAQVLDALQGEVLLDAASKTTPAVAEEYAHYTEGTWSSKGMLELIRQKMSAATLDSDDRPSTSTSSPLGAPPHLPAEQAPGHLQRESRMHQKPIRGEVCSLCIAVQQIAGHFSGWAQVLPRL